LKKSNYGNELHDSLEGNKTMNPIFVEYYSHEQTNCYKMLLPWSEYREEKVVLCKVQDGIDYAKTVALGILVRHTIKSIDSNTPEVK
jgi:hypothetical protein